MLKVYPDTTIYILCPAKIVTGGPEAVHQLAHKLKALGHTVKIVPVPRVQNPTLIQYRNYQVEFAADVDDHEHNILVTTEVNPKALDAYHFIQKAIWWLSVDFHQKLQPDERFDFDSPANQNVVHFAQSAYAHAFLKQRGRQDINYLSDYLNETYLRNNQHTPKNNRVLYTPVKGADVIVSRLRQADSSIEWLALSGMTRKMHAQTIRQGKVYVDFGTHPGKDRQPREAAVNGCCVIVGLSGSSRFYQDLPIPDHYKFENRPESDQEILRTIRTCLSNHERCRQEFASYAALVRQEEAKFEEEVKAIFGLKKFCRRSRISINLQNISLFVKENDAFTSVRALANEFFPLRLTHFAKKYLYFSYCKAKALEPRGFRVYP